MRTAIFLGAGASASETIEPVQQKDLFTGFFSIRNGLWNEHTDHFGMRGDLGGFFSDMFGMAFPRVGAPKEAFPSFEEVLGMIDLAERRKEGFRKYDIGNTAENSGDLLRIRIRLIEMMAVVLGERLKNVKGVHNCLINNLRRAGLLSSVCFVSSNYDILIDNELGRGQNDIGGEGLNYGIEFTNFTRGVDWVRPGQDAINLHKIHGSLNWLYCPTCNTVRLTPFDKGIIRLVTDFSSMTCPECKRFDSDTVYLPIIVPPTFFKEMGSSFLTQIWANAEHDLQQCDHVVFCGYSFPDADIHVKYLLKRIQTYRSDPLSLRFTVINSHSGKSPGQKQEEENRYKRFLGLHVNYEHEMTFEDFARNPASVINRAYAHETRPQRAH